VEGGVEHARIGPPAADEDGVGRRQARQRRRRRACERMLSAATANCSSPH
jgi:hypothetical protein